MNAHALPGVAPPSRAGSGVPVALARSGSARLIACVLLALCTAQAGAADAPAAGRYAMALPLHPQSATGNVAVRAASEVAAAEGQAVTPQRARTLYRMYCAGCHQLDGSGSPGFGVPSMRGTLGHFQNTPAGRAFLVQAPGARNARITDAELAALTNWELQEFSKHTLPPDFKPYTEEEVRRWRANPPLDVAGARAAIASGFPPSP